MSIVTSASAQQAASTTPSSSPEKKTGTKDMGRDDFLTLLVTQLKNQDPLKPMDNTEFVSQLAQFSQLDQSTKLVSLMEKNMAKQDVALQYGMLSMVGRDVRIAGGITQIDPKTFAGTAPLAYTLEGDAAKVKVSIARNDGKIVRTLSFGEQERGAQTIGWDGRDQTGKLVPAGTYHYAVTAADVKGGAVKTATESTVRVTGVRMTDGEPIFIAGDYPIDPQEILEMR